MGTVEEIFFQPESTQPTIYIIKGKEYSYDDHGILRSCSDNKKAVCYPYLVSNNIEMVPTDNGKLIPLVKTEEK